MGGMSSRVLRMSVSDDGKVSHLHDGPVLGYKQLEGASLVMDATSTVLTLTGGRSREFGRTILENSVWILDTKQSKPAWIKGPSLLSPRCFHTSFRLGSQLFVCGGGDETHPILSSVETMSPMDKNAHWTSTVADDYPIKVNITPCSQKRYLFIIKKQMIDY